MVPDCRGQESPVGIAQDSIRLHTKWHTKAEKDFKYLNLGQVYFDLHMSLRNICELVFMYQFTWKSSVRRTDICTRRARRFAALARPGCVKKRI